VLIWDDLNTHLSVAMRQLAAGRDWLHVIQLPAYAPTSRLPRPDRSDPRLAAAVT